MKYIIHIGHTKKHIQLKPNQEISNFIKDFISIIYMLIGITFILQSKSIINLSNIILDVMIFITFISVWFLLFSFIVKEYDTNITE